MNCSGKVTSFMVKCCSCRAEFAVANTPGTVQIDTYTNHTKDRDDTEVVIEKLCPRCGNKVSAVLARI